MHHSGGGMVGGFGLRVGVHVTAASAITALTSPSHGDSALALFGASLDDNASGTRGEVTLGVNGGVGMCTYSPAR